jgi:taspase (threonine aspartase 1)
MLPLRLLLLASVCWRMVRAGCSILTAPATELHVLSVPDPCTNAGTGSNLTWAGTVECDASVSTSVADKCALDASCNLCMLLQIMEGCSQAFGAVGCVAGVAHPISAAAALALESLEPLSCGRVRPM